MEESGEEEGKRGVIGIGLRVEGSVKGKRGRTIEVIDYKETVSSIVEDTKEEK